MAYGAAVRFILMSTPDAMVGLDDELSDHILGWAPEAQAGTNRQTAQQVYTDHGPLLYVESSKGPRFYFIPNDKLRVPHAQITWFQVTMSIGGHAV